MQQPPPPGIGSIRATRRVTAIESAPRTFSGDQLRARNLATVMTLVHRNRRLSRSQLTRVTGLNRSTISAVIGDLVDRGLAVEYPAGPSSRAGRPSPVVGPSSRALAVAVNPEIDAITIGLVGLGGLVLARERIPTRGIPSAAETVSVTSDFVARSHRAAAEPASIVGIGVAVPGLVVSADGSVRNAPHLGWTDEPLSELLTAETGLPSAAANDASLGARAESVFGAGRGVSDLIYLNGGASGIGGGMIVDGSPLGGRDGFAGEWGHTVVANPGRACSCGASGCLETEVRREPLLELLALADADADGLAAALGADPSDLVRAEADRQLAFLGIVLRNAVNALNPELVILGGFLSALHSLDPDRLGRAIATSALPGSRDSVPVVTAALGADLLMIGAAELAFERLLADPASFPRSAGRLSDAVAVPPRQTDNSMNEVAR